MERVLINDADLGAWVGNNEKQTMVAKAEIFKTVTGLSRQTASL